MSLPVRGAWVEMIFRPPQNGHGFSRSPCGERGLKFPSCLIQHFCCMSLPVRGAWVEMRSNGLLVFAHKSRSPCGERGLKCVVLAPGIRGFVVAPRAGSVG